MWGSRHGRFARHRVGAACGFRIFVPLLVASIAIHGGFLTVTPEFAWLGAPRPHPFHSTLLEMQGTTFPSLTIR
ncbi:MAG: DUF4126 domain-containing protein [Akkermansia sp.]